MPGTRSSRRLRNIEASNSGEATQNLFLVDKHAVGEFSFAAYSTLEKAENFMKLNPGSTLVPNCSKDAYRKQFFLEGVEVGDSIHLQLYFSDLTGRTFVGNAYKSSNNCSEDVDEWKVITRDEKECGGEIHVLDLILQ